MAAGGTIAEPLSHLERGLFVGRCTERGVLFAAFDASAHHVEGRLAPSRLAAQLAPFKSAADARHAFERIGAVIESAGR